MHDAYFLKSAVEKYQYPNSRLPGVAFVGRSNVGKSSLINGLVGRKRLARTSSSPGRTQLINFFSVDKSWIFVDLPGYGFAKVPERIRIRWAPMIEEFLTGYKTLKLVVVIVDARHRTTELDSLMLDWLRRYSIRFQVVATKVDKLSKSQRIRSLVDLGESLGSDVLLPFSAMTGEGKRELWKLIKTV